METHSAQLHALLMMVKLNISEQPHYYKLHAKSDKRQTAAYHDY